MLLFGFLVRLRCMFVSFVVLSCLVLALLSCSVLWCMSPLFVDSYICWSIRYVFSSQVVLLVNPLHVFFLFWCVAASFAV